MRRTKDQKELSEVLSLAVEARDAASSLFSRRLDTQRNLDSFIGLKDALNLLKEACDTLETAIDQAIETKSSDQNSVINEIMIRSGRAADVPNNGNEDQRKAKAPAVILNFPKK